MTGPALEVEANQRRSRSIGLDDARAGWPLVLLTGLAVAFGTIVRTQLLGAASLWLDELWTLDAISRSFKEMIGARLASDVNPPIWNSAAWLWLRIVGTYDAVAMRLLPLIFGLIAVVIPLVGAIQLRSIRPALLVMGASTALSLFPLQYSVELRSYSLLLALGTLATVIWAGLLTGDLPAGWQWIFLFALTGALAGFSHYYGNLLYLAELLVLLAAWGMARRRGEVRTLAAWAVVSFLPVATWLGLQLAFSLFPSAFSADPPSVTVLQTWLAYAFAPISNVVAGHGPGYAYPAGPFGVETILFIAVVALALVAGLAAFGRVRLPVWVPAAGVGVASVAAIGLGIAIAWLESIVGPPSMTTRNLAGLLPLLFLATACAVTSLGSERIRWGGGAAAVGAWLLASVAFATQFGVTALAPPWQAQAGYRTAVQALLSEVGADPSTVLVGLELPWGWHGEWDAAVRSQLGRPPAESADPPPIAVRWIRTADQLPAADLPVAPIVAFTDANGTALFTSIKAARPGCTETTFGGPGYGVSQMLRCPSP